MIDDLLSRLERVKRTGPSSWIASCPTRDDKHPSMTIRLLDDGRVLLHDFGGASAAEILDSLNLDWSALFPADTKHQAKPERRPFSSSDILKIIAFEALVVAAVGSSMHKGRTVSEADYQRLWKSVSRIQSAAKGVNL